MLKNIKNNIVPGQKFILRQIRLNKFSSRRENEIEKEYLRLDYYSLLNVKKTSTENEIRKSYYVLAKKYHPDKFKGSSEIFKRITEGYHILKDSHKREEYNKKFKIKFHHQKGKSTGKENYDEGSKPNSNTQDTGSKYEKELKKLNIDKLFFQFTHQKIKHAPENIKV
jgi:curved DNA-binding protein CbpA